jgi:hypothetical protein
MLLFHAASYDRESDVIGSAESLHFLKCSMQTVLYARSKQTSTDNIYGKRLLFGLCALWRVHDEHPLTGLHPEFFYQRTFCHESPYYTLGQAATIILQKHPDTVRRLCQKGKIEGARKIGGE